jgi:hypothetical protein
LDNLCYAFVNLQTATLLQLCNVFHSPVPFYGMLIVVLILLIALLHIILTMLIGPAYQSLFEESPHPFNR